jgi:hypothetical protein
MKTTTDPTRSTIVIGLISGIGYIPFSLFCNSFMPEALAFRCMIWSNLVLYTCFLTRWGKQKYSSVTFPLVIPGIFLFIENPITTYLILCLGILSWIRSGICFQGKVYKKIGIEILICGGSGILIIWSAPLSSISWAMGTWLFYLIQSLYFLFQSNADINPVEEPEIDPFRQASVQAERILEGH